MDDVTKPSLNPADVLQLYHERTKHALKGFARGPDTLDWDAQPDPFREFAGAPRFPLSLPAGDLTASFRDLFCPNQVTAQLPDLEALGSLLRYSFGLAAWKEYGPDRWALRCNPSSGNLHPTEVYVILQGYPGVEDGLYHYLPREHALELRCRHGDRGKSASGLWVGLTSVHWREAWKYGERAFRYCLLDTGHAFGALSYAAAALGWRARQVQTIASDKLATLLGTDRLKDFDGAEIEEPEMLVSLMFPGSDSADPKAPEVEASSWFGQANILDPHPMYRWPIIEEVAEATRAMSATRTSAEPWQEAIPPLEKVAGDIRTGELFLQRRSAQRFDARTPLPQASFFAILDALLPRLDSPFSGLAGGVRLHPVLFVIRVEGVEPGVYALPRSPEAAERMKALFDPDFIWQDVEGAPEHLPLQRLIDGDRRHIARMVSCSQWIASDGCFSLGMLAEFEDHVRANPYAYRQLHFEAGLLGQVLYLEAEAAGFRGTGIGCFLDDDFHGTLGLAGQTFQSLYHFTIGMPKLDTRITTSAPYPDV